MGAEIERKFLVDTARWEPQGKGELYVQGYLSSAKERTVRVRREGDRAVITVKGPNKGVTRAEFEYPIPPADADAMLTLCEQPLIEKRRHKEEHGGHTWEIDVFAGENDGLVVAEIELKSEAETFDKPAWVGREVSDDARYYNASLIKAPYKTW
ncbi:MAG TPA: CYTH domain-containing protein [Kofleriaceae bacterium]|jgi:adenylate cyclase